MQAQILPIRTFTCSVIPVCNAAMEISDVRRANTRFLALTVGGIGSMAFRMGKSQSQISHLIGEKPIKGIGNMIARQINAEFGKPAGWLDQRQEAHNYELLLRSDWSHLDADQALTGQTQRAGENPTTVVADATTGSLATTTPTARTVIERIIHAASTGELNDEAMKAIGKAAEQMRKPPQVSANDYPYIPTAHDP